MNYRNTSQEPAGGKSRDIKTSFFPTRRVPTVQVSVTLVLKKATDSQQAVSRASASQDCARLTSFSWYHPLLGASVGLPFGEELVGVQVCRQTHFYRSGSEHKRQRLKDIGLFIFPSLSLCLMLSVSSSWRGTVLSRVNDPDVVFLTPYFRAYWCPSNDGEGCVFCLPLGDFHAHLP